MPRVDVAVIFVARLCARRVLERVAQSARRVLLTTASTARAAAVLELAALERVRAAGRLTSLSRLHSRLAWPRQGAGREENFVPRKKDARTK